MINLTPDDCALLLRLLDQLRCEQVHGNRVRSYASAYLEERAREADRLVPLIERLLAEEPRTTQLTYSATGTTEEPQP